MNLAILQLGFAYTLETQGKHFGHSWTQSTVEEKPGSESLPLHRPVWHSRLQSLLGYLHSSTVVSGYQTGISSSTVIQQKPPGLPQSARVSGSDQDLPGQQETFSAVPLSMKGRSVKLFEDLRPRKLCKSSYASANITCPPTDLSLRKLARESVSPDLSTSDTFLFVLFTFFLI